MFCAMLESSAHHHAVCSDGLKSGTKHVSIVGQVVVVLRSITGEHENLSLEITCNVRKIQPGLAESGKIGSGNRQGLARPSSSNSVRHNRSGSLR